MALTAIISIFFSYFVGYADGYDDGKQHWTAYIKGSWTDVTATSDWGWE